MQGVNLEWTFVVFVRHHDGWLVVVLVVVVVHAVVDLTVNHLALRCIGLTPMGSFVASDAGNTR